MSTLLELRSLVLQGLGGRDDTATIAIANASLNFASVLAALMFNPPELEEEGTLVVTGGSSKAGLSSLSSLLDVRVVWNNTDGLKMWFIPFEAWHVILPTTVGKTKFYSVLGDTLYVKDTPSVNKTLTIYYSTYPPQMVNDANPLGFDYHDAYVVSVASGISWAFLEEGESAAAMQKVAELATVPFALGSRARQVIEGQRTTLEALLQSGGGA